MPTLALARLAAAAALCATPSTAPDPQPADDPVVRASVTAPSAPTPPPAPPLVERVHAYYFQGDYTRALDAYETAARASTTTAEPWANGAVILEELGDRKRAVEWYRRAAALTADPDVWSALGWAQFRTGDMRSAGESFDRALFRDPKNAYGLMGLARVRVREGDAEEAIRLLRRAEESAPLLNLAAYYEGEAYERMGQPGKAIDAYKRAVIADSYFFEGRDALGRTYVKKKQYNEAWRQYTRILEADQHNRRFAALLRKISPYLTRARWRLAGGAAAPRERAQIVPSAIAPDVPTIRIGLGTNALGKPKPRQSLAFRVTADFTINDARGRVLLSGGAKESWRVRLRRAKRRRLIVVTDGSGKMVLQTRNALVIKPSAADTAVIHLDDVALSNNPNGPAVGGKIVRGSLEVSIFGSNLRVVNVLDLENYTQGVVAAEMPIGSPIEALKAQAVVARSHALFIMKVSKRHRHEGYEVCDGEHCQVYAGVRVESDRSRQVVESTRGRVVLYKGGIAHVIYSSNCGGHTQSGRDLTGWGNVPYWTGIPDGTSNGDWPRSAWQLKRWLTSWPEAYCQPSSDVHPSHYRWSRVVAWTQLEERLARHYRLGKLKSLRVLRRSISGNVNAIQFIGTRRKVKVSDEMQIRGLLATGSLRSTQFMFDLDYSADGHPQALVFHGGGWGHGVGLCQSGAMGRAEAGQSYEDIIKAYFKGVELSQLDYAPSAAAK